MRLKQTGKQAQFKFATSGIKDDGETMYSLTLTCKNTVGTESFSWI